MKPPDAEEIKKNVKIGTDLNIFYDTIDVDEARNLITFYSDIYEMGTNNDRNLAEKLRVMSVDDLNKTNVLDILLAAEDNTKKHLNAAIELCVKYIEPRKPGTVVTLLDDHPEVQEYLDTMKKYRSISVNISDLL